MSNPKPNKARSLVNVVDGNLVFAMLDRSLQSAMIHLAFFWNDR